MRLDSYLELHGISLRGLARRAHVAHTTIGRLLRGEAVPDLASVEAISTATEGQVSKAEVLASFGASNTRPAATAAVPATVAA